MIKFISMPFEDFIVEDVSLCRSKASLVSKKVVKRETYYLLLIYKGEFPKTRNHPNRWFVWWVNKLIAGITGRKVRNVLHYRSGLPDKCFAFIGLTKKDYEKFMKLDVWKAPRKNSSMSAASNLPNSIHGSFTSLQGGSWMELDVAKV
jgi:hypothetical protein